MNDGVIAKIEVTLYASGALSTSGNIADKKFAVALLENAIDAVKSRKNGLIDIVTPNYDVGIPSSKFPLIEDKPH